MIRKRIFAVLSGLLVLAVFIWVGLYGWIQMTAHQKAKAVQAAYPQVGSVAEALVLQIQNEAESMQKRNAAVWIAGRLRIKEALPVMQSYVTGTECDHKICLCQHELKKAIKRCGI